MTRKERESSVRLNKRGKQTEVVQKLIINMSIVKNLYENLDE